MYRRADKPITSTNPKDATDVPHLCDGTTARLGPCSFLLACSFVSMLESGDRVALDAILAALTRIGIEASL